MVLLHTSEVYDINGKVVQICGVQKHLTGRVLQQELV